MSKKIDMSARPQVASRQADHWVDQQASPERGPTMRLTVDVPSDNHARFKALCAMRKTKITTEINAFIQRRLDDVEEPGVS